MTLQRAICSSIICFGLAVLAGRNLPTAEACSCVGGGSLTIERGDLELVDGEPTDGYAWRREGYVQNDWGSYEIYFEGSEPGTSYWLGLERVP